MLKTIDTAVDYITDTVNAVETTENALTKDLVKEALTDGLLDSLGKQNISQDILDELNEHIDDQEYIDAILTGRIANYCTLLTNLSNEIIADYLIEDEATENKEEFLSPSLN